MLGYDFDAVAEDHFARQGEIPAGVVFDNAYFGTVEITAFATCA